MTPEAHQHGCVGAGSAGAHAPLPAFTVRLRRRAVARMTVKRPDYLRRFTRDFEFASPDAGQRTTDIANTFLAGYNVLAAGGTPDQVRAGADRVPRYLRPFWYEGAAMGFGPYAWHTGGDVAGFEAFADQLSPGTVYQNYVGFGWWLGTIHARRPGRIARAVAALDFRYRQLCYEGIGFKAGFTSAGRRTATTGIRRGDDAAARLWFQGYGRSLWFVHMGDLPAALHAAGRAGPAHVADCVSGLGLGVAFSYLDRIAELGSLAAAVPASLRAEFEQGLSFGWEARQLADPGLFAEHLADLTPELRGQVGRCVSDVHRVRDGLLHAGSEADFYNRWRSGLIDIRRTAAPLFPLSSVKAAPS